MTGKHTGHASVRGNRQPEYGLAKGEGTVASLLRTHGYRTALFGKWGLGGFDADSHPNDRGFEQFFGYLNQLHAHNSYPEHLWENKREFLIPENWFDRKKTFSNDLFTERALRFISEQKSDPFFLYLTYTIPHADNERGNFTKNGIDVPDQGKYAGESWPEVEKNFAAAITRMDDQIGKVLAALDTKGLRENTLVIFTSDNGPHKEGNHDPTFFQSSGAVRGTKRDLYEGGIRVPAIANWKGKIKPGQLSDHAWAFWDFLPTAAELAGAPVPPGLDGISFLPALTGGKQPAHDYLYWEFFEGGFQQAVRQEDWKLVRQIPEQQLELFDLKSDLRELNNVAASHPEVVAKMKALFTTAHTDHPSFPRS
jgi:arylsulfatase A-like enzyme